jgi:hypothetical protein
MKDNKVTNEFKIEPGEKFALLLSHLYPIEGLNAPLQLIEQIWVLPSVPITITEFWEEQLGSLIIDSLSKSNFCIVAKRHSDQLSVSDDINKLLIECVEKIFECIMYQGIPNVKHIYAFSGSNIDGKFDICKFVQFDRIYPIEKSNPSCVTLHKLKQTIVMCNQYHNIFLTKGKFQRLQSGLHSLLRAIREDYLDFRMHEYVRALEALIKPRPGRTRANFVHRCQTLAQACPKADEILKNIYDLRSANEHLNSWLIPVCGSIRKAKERLWQTENLVLKSYTNLLSNQILLQNFITDDNIEAFWKLPDDKRQKIWNNPVDLRRFRWVNLGYGVEMLDEAI